MTKIYVILGEMTFLELVNDGEHSAIIHRIDEIKSFDTYEEAEDYGENTITGGGGFDGRFEAYLIPQNYTGEIKMELNN